MCVCVCVYFAFFVLWGKQFVNMITLKGFKLLHFRVIDIFGHVAVMVKKGSLSFWGINVSPPPVSSGRSDY